MQFLNKSVVFILTIVLIFILVPRPALSEMSDHGLEKEVKALKEKVEKLGVLERLGERVGLSALVEVEASAGNGFNGVDESDIVLATVELGLDAKIAEYVKAHLQFLWEEDDTEPIDMDEGTVTVGNTERFPVYFTAGKMYVPFGAFETNMIQDPLTLEIGETNQSAIQVGFEVTGLCGSIYAFNGNIDEKEDPDDNEIKCFGANIGYAFEGDSMRLKLGADWINNIADSKLLTDVFEEKNVDHIRDYVGGLALHLTFNLGSFTFIGEYVGATDEFHDGELDFKGRGARPRAWNIELAYTRDILGSETTFALGYQGTDEALALELPKDRYLAAIGTGLVENASITLEYLHDEDYGKSDGGTDDDANMVTFQLAVEF